MRHVLSMGLLLCTAALFGCAEEGDAGLETTSSDNTLVGTTNSGSTTGTEDYDCTVGFQIGQCPDDIALPNSTGELVSLHDQRGSRVLAISSAWW